MWTIAQQADKQIIIFRGGDNKNILNAILERSHDIHNRLVKLKCSWIYVHIYLRR